MRLFYIDPSPASQSRVTIEGSQAHHIKNVLRLKPGGHLRLFDGTGSDYDAVIVSIDADKIEVEIQRKHQSGLGPRIRIVVAQAFLKEKKMDDLVRRLSELGIAGWIPFFSQRSIARPGRARLAGRIQRWQRIATEAAKQCRRKDILAISETLTFDEVLALGKSYDLKTVFWENEPKPISRDILSTPGIDIKSILVMLGPEGGFTESEVDMARLSGFVTAGLGPRILRAETAALAASALIQYLYGDMGP
jgi:16S rRNA (uracil1498-N3)-methyltransferase